ncbi:M23 family metallopeptidase [Leifsonia sp. NPDC058248]|uniref:M23 family metallopeptidase n=1 Tax=Leifsonia sp. NPDC058248 TaxID=3346402 RepID=UPI0036DE49D9
MPFRRASRAGAVRLRRASNGGSDMGRDRFSGLGRRLLVGLAVGGLLAGAAGAPAQASVVFTAAAGESSAAPVTRQSLEVDTAVETPNVARDTATVRHVPLPPPPPRVVWPVGAGAAVSDGFGARVAPTAGASSNHQGVDFDPGLGTPVHSAAAGVVRETVTTDSGGCGVNITIDHRQNGAPFSTVYCHLAVGSVVVAPGQRVAAGQQIASVGDTGVSTGAHLHFEVHPGGGAAVDPLAWLHAHAT